MKKCLKHHRFPIMTDIIIEPDGKITICNLSKELLPIVKKLSPDNKLFKRVKIKKRA